MRVGECREPGVEAVARGDHPHVAGGGLGDDRRDVRPLRGEGRLDGDEVVVGQHDGVAGRRAGDPGRVGQAEGGDAGAGGGEQPVGVAVVAAGELDDLGAAGEAPGQPDRRHGRLGPRVDQPDLLDRGAVDDLGGQLHLTRGGGAEAGAEGGGLPDRLDHLGVGVAQDQRPPGADQVDVAPPVGVVQPGTLPDHEARGATDGTERAHRGVHPAGHDGQGAVEQGLGGRCVGRVATGAGGKGIRHDAAIVSAPDGESAGTPGRGYPAHPPDRGRNTARRCDDRHGGSPRRAGSPRSR